MSIIEQLERMPRVKQTHKYSMRTETTVDDCIVNVAHVLTRKELHDTWDPPVVAGGNMPLDTNTGAFLMHYWDSHGHFMDFDNDLWYYLDTLGIIELERQLRNLDRNRRRKQGIISVERLSSRERIEFAIQYAQAKFAIATRLREHPSFEGIDVNQTVTLFPLLSGKDVYLGVMDDPTTYSFTVTHEPPDTFADYYIPRYLNEFGSEALRWRPPPARPEEPVYVST